MSHEDDDDHWCRETSKCHLFPSKIKVLSTFLFTSLWKSSWWHPSMEFLCTQKSIILVWPWKSIKNFRRFFPRVELFWKFVQLARRMPFITIMLSSAWNLSEIIGSRESCFLWNQKRFSRYPKEFPHDIIWTLFLKRNFLLQRLFEWKEMFWRIFPSSPFLNVSSEINMMRGTLIYLITITPDAHYKKRFIFIQKHNFEYLQAPFPSINKHQLVYYCWCCCSSCQ